jgi:hypothetical protein
VDILITAEIPMSRHTSTSPGSARRNISIIRPDNASSFGSADHLPALGGLAAVCLFIVILFAFVVQSAVTQVSTNIDGQTCILSRLDFLV